MGIHQEIQFRASPEEIYATLTSGNSFGRFTGAPAQFDAVEGAPFSFFGGQITGRNIDLIPDKSLVQAWRAGAWPSSVYSIVRIALEKEGDGTKLTLDQSGFPEGAAEHLEGGWHKMYWEPLRSYLG